ncbi:unnamed protein product [Closterium sp. NIES-54]
MSEVAASRDRLCSLRFIGAPGQDLADSSASGGAGDSGAGDDDDDASGDDDDDASGDVAAFDMSPTASCVDPRRVENMSVSGMALPGNAPPVSSSRLMPPQFSSDGPQYDPNPTAAGADSAKTAAVPPDDKICTDESASSSNWPLIRPKQVTAGAATAVPSATDILPFSEKEELPQRETVCRAVAS